MERHSKTRCIWFVAASAVAALAAWPAFVSSHGAPPPLAPTPAWTAAPVLSDYLNRDALVAFYESDARRNRSDQIVAQMLASQYMQRYRERADVGDLERARSETKRSLALQPHFNYNANMEMASVLLSFHRMREALSYAREAQRIEPWSYGAKAMTANLDMEVGAYSSARAVLRDRPASDDSAWDLSLARFDELTGHLTSARTLVEGVQQRTDEVVDNPAESRAWAHWREGELAFAAGDYRSAQVRYEEALAIFPTYWHAYNGLAKLHWARKQWPQALDAATKGAELYPLPETLGYKYDAQSALGDKAGAAATRDLIYAIERIGNAQGTSDRLIALFYADHDLRPDDAVAIARRDLARRADIYSEDTLAWALAAAGRWQEASPHAEAAVRLGTEDARLQYHAAVIALHSGHRDEATSRLRFALSVNPQFHPVEADDARRLLSR